MTKRTRYFVMGSVGFMAVALTVGLAAYYGGIRGFAEQAGPDELNYVPADAAVVAYANVRELMGSQFRQQLKALEPADQEQGRAELKNTLGIDIEQNIDYVVACVLASPTLDGGNTKNGYVVAHGTFDRTRIEAFIREKGGVERQYKNHTMFVHQAAAAPVPSGGEAQEMGVTFISNEVVALGTATALQKVIDVQTGAAAGVRTNGDVMTMIDRAASAGNVWAVGRFDVLSKQANLPTEVQGQIPQLTWFSATGRVNGGLEGTVTVEARDDDAAKNLRAVVGGFIGLAKMQAASKPELNALVQAVTLNGDTGKTVSVSFAVPSAAIEALKGAMMNKQLKPEPKPRPTPQDQPRPQPK
jgi:hypothetical protein